MSFRSGLPVPLRGVCVLMLGAALPGFAVAETRGSLNLYGVSGLIDMPSAESQRDGDLSATISRFGPTTRTTLTFQITPRLQGSFRYTGVRGLALAGFTRKDTYFDRSFDLRFRVLDEGRYWPSVTVGLQDFIGTGNFAGEYIVATKTFADRVKVTAGLGWGRLGSFKPIGSVGKRGGAAVATGGTPNFGQWFRGPVAPFGGIEWQVNDRFGLKMEYSSDAYAEEAGKQGLFKRASPLNFGAEYQLNKSIRLGAYYLYGSEIGLAAHISLNPKDRPTGAFKGPAAGAVVLRPSRQGNPAAWSDSWASVGGQAAGESLQGRLAERLKADGLMLEALAVTGTSVEVRIRNPRYDAGAQAIGRTARALTQVMPASVERFAIVPVVNGIATSRIRLNRSDIEALEHAPDNARALRARAVIEDAADTPADLVRVPGQYPRIGWGIMPYTRFGLFDPSDPLRADVGLRFSGRVDLAPGLVLEGAVTQRLAGNLKRYNRPSNSVLPHVRTDDYLRNRRSTELERLTLAWYARPATDIYSRVTAGYLERGFAGVSGEVLWKPVNSRLALGAEVNYVRQRSFTKALGLGTYGVATGHVSAYYEFANGFLAQLDVGRYLAGDIGATLSIDREFANGWRVGAFATKTNVSSQRFGEGSFDKGIRVAIPLNWITGTAIKGSAGTTLRPVQRDGGARLNVNGRLYETVRGDHAKRLDDQWGRVWR